MSATAGGSELWLPRLWRSAVAGAGWRPGGLGRSGVAPNASGAVRGPQGDGGVRHAVDCSVVGTRQSHLLLGYKDSSIGFYS